MISSINFKLQVFVQYDTQCSQLNHETIESHMFEKHLKWVWLFLTLILKELKLVEFFWAKTGLKLKGKFHFSPSHHCPLSSSLLLIVLPFLTQWIVLLQKVKQLSMTFWPRAFKLDVILHERGKVKKHNWTKFLVNSCRFLSILVNSCQFLSIFVNSCQFLSILVNSCQFFQLCIKSPNKNNNNKQDNLRTAPLRYSRSKNTSTYFTWSQILKSCQTFQLSNYHILKSCQNMLNFTILIKSCQNMLNFTMVESCQNVSNFTMLKSCQCLSNFSMLKSCQNMSKTFKTFSKPFPDFFNADKTFHDIFKTFPGFFQDFFETFSRISWLSRRLRPQRLSRWLLSCWNLVKTRLISS